MTTWYLIIIIASGYVPNPTSQMKVEFQTEEACNLTKDAVILGLAAQSRVEYTVICAKDK